MENEIITIWGNPDFACEFAYILAKLTNLNICIMDLDLLCPSVDLYLGVEKYVSKINFGKDLTSYDLLESAIEKNCLTKDITLKAAIRRKEIKNLYVYTGSFDINKYEYFTQDAVVKIIDNCRSTYDKTIIIVNKSIYDLFTCISLYKSNINIVSMRGFTHDIRHYNNCIEFLYEKQDIPVCKNKFVTYNYDAEEDADIDLIKELSNYNYLGFISKSKKRNVCIKNNRPYCTSMEYKILCQYKMIFYKLGYIPKITVKERIAGKLKKHDLPEGKEYVNAADSIAT